MHRDKSLTEIAGLPPRDRWRLAREKLNNHQGEGLVEALAQHLRAHENTRWLIYEPHVTGQVPTSHAGHAFAELQKGVFHYEVMRLCTFWDSVDLDSRSIPTIAALADCRGVSKCVREDHFSGWIEAVGPSRAKNYATRAGRQLRMGIRAAKAAEGSDLLRQTRNFRDKLAHQLEHNRAETAAVIPPPLYGDERILLRKTRTIVNNLYLSLNGTGFAWDAAIEMNRRDAEALWKGVTINVLR